MKYFSNSDHDKIDGIRKWLRTVRFPRARTVVPLTRTISAVDLMTALSEALLSSNKSIRASEAIAHPRFVIGSMN